MLLPVFYMPAQLVGNTLTWIEKRIIEGKVKHDCRIVFIDHLHYTVDMRSKNNMSLEIGAVMRALKRLAVKHNICIFIIAHLGKVRPEYEPDNQDLRDSSFIAQESDNVIIIWRKEGSDNEGVIKISKNRKTGERRKIDIYKGEFGIREVEKE
jgi:replicative DNA helicase